MAILFLFARIEAEFGTLSPTRKSTIIRDKMPPISTVRAFGTLAMIGICVSMVLGPTVSSLVAETCVGTVDGRSSGMRVDANTVDRRISFAASLTVLIEWLAAVGIGKSYSWAD